MSINKKLRTAAMFALLLAAVNNFLYAAEVAVEAESADTGAAINISKCNQVSAVCELVTALARGPLSYLTQKAKLEALKNAKSNDKKAIFICMARDLTRLTHGVLATVNTSKKHGFMAGEKLASTSETVVPAMWMAEDLRSLGLNIKKLLWDKKEKKVVLADLALAALDENNKSAIATDKIDVQEEYKLSELQEVLILNVLPKIEGIVASLGAVDSLISAFSEDGKSIHELSWICSVVISSIRSMESLIESRPESKERIWAYTKIAVTATCCFVDIVAKMFVEAAAWDKSVATHEKIGGDNATGGGSDGEEVNVLGDAAVENNDNSRGRRPTCGLGQRRASSVPAVKHKKNTALNVTNDAEFHDGHKGITGTKTPNTPPNTTSTKASATSTQTTPPTPVTTTTTTAATNAEKTQTLAVFKKLFKPESCCVTQIDHSPVNPQMAVVEQVNSKQPYPEVNATPNIIQRATTNTITTDENDNLFAALGTDEADDVAGGQSNAGGASASKALITSEQPKVGTVVTSNVPLPKPVQQFVSNLPKFVQDKVNGGFAAAFNLASRSEKDGKNDNKRKQIASTPTPTTASTTQTPNTTTTTATTATTATAATGTNTAGGKKN